MNYLLVILLLIVELTLYYDRYIDISQYFLFFSYYLCFH